MIEQSVYIKTIIVCTNGMVVVFGNSGEQLPHFQGEWNEKKESILAQIGYQGANYIPACSICNWSRGSLDVDVEVLRRLNLELVK